jgi:Mn-containing catalase
LINTNRITSGPRYRLEVDVKAVLKNRLSEAFAGTFGFLPGTMRYWEQRRRMPDQAARMYLWAIGQRPDHHARNSRSAYG